MTAMSLGLAHSLSRYKLKFSPDKIDTMIVQAVSLLDDLDKELNNYIMRTREWYNLWIAFIRSYPPLAFFHWQYCCATLVLPSSVSLIGHCLQFWAQLLVIPYENICDYGTVEL